MRARARRLGLAVTAVVLSTLAWAAQAQDYALVKGDKIRIAFDGDREAIEMLIDIEGGIRLLDVGRVSLAGRGLDEAEALVEEAIAEVGLFVDPKVLISVVEYAPVVVAGDVAAPGRFEFLPGMTVATALGLSGGALSTGINQLEIERARTEVNGQIMLINVDIATALVEIVTLEAGLAGDGAQVALSDTARRAIPVPDAVDLPRMLQGAAAVLTAERQLLAEARALWQAEIETLEAQKRLFASRIAVQNEIVETAQADLANAEALQERGLQTAARLSNVQQREADARARLLELESADIATTRAIGEARRELLRFASAFRRDRLTALQAARARLDEQQMRYARALEHRSLLSGDNVQALFASAGVTVSFSVASAREGRTMVEGLRQNSPLLPGDTLIVRVETDLPPRAN